jgi:hypothetical protein
MAEAKKPERKPGVCVPWEEKVKELNEIKTDKELVQKVWGNVDGLGYVYIWQCLLSF